MVNTSFVSSRERVYNLVLINKAVVSLKNERIGAFLLGILFKTSVRYKFRNKT